MRIRAGRLIAEEFDPRAFRYAMSVAERWRESGLTVELVEYMPLGGEPQGYVISAASGTTMMVLRSQRWCQRRWFRRKRLVWTMSIAVRHRDPAAVNGSDSAWLPAREVGVVAALDQERLWEQVEDWIAGRLRPYSSVEEALRSLP
ncbi:hypothetical protein [Benzoatithermus flavus]|uniref:Uncharacterized protein n=1 Tax=Benzoatithermus flavus TaxID=3108223 RepID=A0ABU8XRC4_9PROT